MKINKIIVIGTVIAIGTIIAIRFGAKSMMNGVDKNAPEIIKEGKKLAKAKDINTFVDNAFTMYKKHSPISNDVWEGYDLKEKVFVVGEIDSKTGKAIKAWKFNQTDKRELTEEEIKEITFPSVGGYNKIKFEEKEGIVMSINKSLIPMLSFMDFNYIYEIGVHEMYHFYGDDMTKYEQQTEDGEDGNGRYTTFPQEVMPRVYRKMIYDNLVLAYKNTEDEKIYLGKAKYWNEKWKTEYPEEYNRILSTDILEGKARYVEYLMCIDYKGISEKEKIDAIKSLFNQNTEVFDGIDSESYELGFVSGVLLDRNNPGWKTEINKNPQRPVEMILKDVKPEKDDSDNFDKVLESGKSQINKANKNIQKKIKNIEEAENNNIPLLKLNADSMVGSFSISESIEYKGKGVYLDLSATFKSDNGSASVDGLSLYLSSEGNYCILPITMKYKVENNRLIIDEKNVSVDLKVQETKDSDGRTVYTME